MQEMDANSCSPNASPLRKREPIPAPSPSQIHKQYWDGVAKRAAAAKPPKSPLPPSAGGGKTQPGTLSPRRGGSPMNVKVPAKSPLQGMAANVVKAAHTNPLFSVAQHTPKAQGWKSITKTEHASKENSAPANTGPRPTNTFGKPVSKPISSKIPAPPTAAPITNTVDELVTIPLTPEKSSKAATAPVTKADPVKADTVIDITQAVKNRVDYALNTPPNTPVMEDGQTATPVNDNPQYSPSNNPFSPRPEYRRSSLARTATPGRSSLASQPDWTSLLCTPAQENSADLVTPPRTTANAFPVSGGSPQFIEVFLPQPGSERATPRRRLRMAAENDNTSESAVSKETETPGTPRPKSRVRLALKLLFAVVVALALGEIAVSPGWIPRALREPVLLSGVAPRGLWQETPGIETYTGNAWFSSTLFADSDGAASLQRTLFEASGDQDDARLRREQALNLPRADTAAAVTVPALPVIHLEFDEYDGADNLEEIVPEDQPDHAVEPTHHDASTWQELPDFDAADVSSNAAPDSSVTSQRNHVGEADVSVGESEMEAEAFISATETALTDAKPVVSYANPVVNADAAPSVYETQQREAALLEMADLAVRSYTSAFLAALALFGVFSLTAFVATHFLPPMARGDVTADAADDGDDVAAEGDDVSGGATGAPEVTTPMFLRQGARMEDSVVVSPRGVNAGSPFGRYHAFVRQMTGQNTEAPQLTLTPVQRSRRLADKFRAVAGSPSRRFALSPA